jgi:hypothetical protein
MTPGAFRGTDGSNPVPSSGESAANLHFSIRRRKFAKRDGEALRASQTLDRAERRAKVVAKRSQTYFLGDPTTVVPGGAQPCIIR